MANKVYPKTKQREAFVKVMNGQSVSSAMREVGYATKTAKNPKNLTESKGWSELLEDNLPDKLLAKVHNEGLKALKIHGTQDDFIEVPDFPTRHKYLETAYKIKGKVVDLTANIDIKPLIDLDE